MPVRTFDFTLSESGSGFSVHLNVGDQSASSTFQFDLRRESRLNEVIASMQDGVVTYDQLLDVGANLFKGLISGDVGTLFDRVREDDEQSFVPANQLDRLQFVLRLKLPVSLRYLPWECLYEEDRGFGFLLNRLRYSLVRDTNVGTVPTAARPDGKIRILAVVPQGSGLNVDKELHGLQVAVGRIKDDAVELEILEGRVTADRLCERINQRVWDIVHFVGHGDMVDGRARIRLNDEDPEADDAWVHGEIFATFFEQNVPRLVVLNCCLGGSNASQRSFSGLGPFLLRAGIPAVVAMQYEIRDTVAIRFASTFYGELIAGTAPGRIDLALAAARRSLFQNPIPDRPQSFVTPVLYLAPGHEVLFELARPEAPAPIAEKKRAESTVRIPKDLLEAFADRRIVPVLGPELLSVGSNRTSAVPGPRDLARLLAEEAQITWADLVNASSGDVDSVWLLPEICQAYESQNERWRLVTAVQKIYHTASPPDAVQKVAAWNVPGIICAYFDGLVTEAMAKTERRSYSLLGIDQKVAGYNGDETLVVNVRGVHTEIDSLVLTERDEEQLLVRLADLSSQVLDLTRKSIGRSLLFLGVSPKDPVIRRLTRLLRGNGRNQGPTYFVGVDRPGSQSYWDDFKVRWLPMPLEEFMAELGDGQSAG